MSFTSEEMTFINQALKLIDSKAKKEPVFNNAEMAKNYFKLALSPNDRELFGVAFLNSQHILIDFEIMFMGDIDSAAVYPKQICKRALEMNAAALIIGHNHPSGISEPSQADINITNRIKKALDLLDIRLLDHLIVANQGSVSLANRGLV